MKYYDGDKMIRYEIDSDGDDFLILSMKYVILLRVYTVVGDTRAMIIKTVTVSLVIIQRIHYVR